MKALDELRITVAAEDSVLYESPYWGQHGIALHLEARASGRDMRILVDVGQNFEALHHNMDILGISAGDLDALVLTHCHYDHTMGAAELVRATGRSGFPVIAHPAIFREHFVLEPDRKDIGVQPDDCRERIEAAGGRLMLSSEPVELMPGLIVTGKVPRVTDFERPPAIFRTVVDGKIVADAMEDDISVAANVAGRGVTVVTGCSHAGIINILRHVHSLSGEVPIDGIIGGFHLIESDASVIGRTVSELEDVHPSWIAAGHCTGFRGQMALRSAFGDEFTPLRTGMSFTLDASGLRISPNRIC